MWVPHTIVFFKILFDSNVSAQLKVFLAKPWMSTIGWCTKTFSSCRQNWKTLLCGLEFCVVIFEVWLNTVMLMGLHGCWCMDINCLLYVVLQGTMVVQCRFVCGEWRCERNGNWDNFIDIWIISFCWWLHYHAQDILLVGNTIPLHCTTHTSGQLIRQRDYRRGTFDSLEKL